MWENTHFVLGVIGGVGSGKSSVLAYLEEQYGFSVIRTDDIAKRLMQPGSALLKRLSIVFLERGESILADDGSLDKRRYASLIYENGSLRALSDQTVHPAVWEEVRREIEISPARSIAVETALPDRAFREKLCRAVWFVNASPSVRIRRLTESRGLSEAEASRIIRNQPDSLYYAGLSDAVIDNGGSAEETERQIDRLLRQTSVL